MAPRQTPAQTPALRRQADQLLADLSAELKKLGLWQQQAPEPAALQSQLPFATDTLAFHQWLQFIMIPQLKHRLARQQVLPTNIAVSPMAIQVYRGDLQRHRRLIQRLKELDTLLSGANPLTGDHHGSA